MEKSIKQKRGKFFKDRYGRRIFTLYIIMRTDMSQD